jgi:hypothetical protein
MRAVTCWNYSPGCRMAGWARAGQIDLTGKIVTAGALHTVKATANHIHAHGGEFALPVKENRPALPLD